MTHIEVKYVENWPRYQYTVLAKKTLARLRELATVLGASSRNLADIFLANAVHQVMILIKVTF